MSISSGIITFIMYFFSWIPWLGQTSSLVSENKEAPNFYEYCMMKKKEALKKKQASNIELSYVREAYEKISEESIYTSKNPYIGKKMRSLSKNRAKLILEQYEESEKKHKRLENNFYDIQGC